MNCKPGDLAWIICDEAGDGRNLGLVVEVLRLLPPCGCSRCAQAPSAAWECVSTGREIVGQVILGPIAFITRSHRADIPDAWLKPIPKDGLTDEEVRELYAPGEREVSHG